MSDSLSDYVTTKEAAEKMGVVTEHINHLLAADKIRGKRMGKQWLVYVPSLEHYIETKSPGGRPPSRQIENKKN